MTVESRLHGPIQLRAIFCALFAITLFEFFGKQHEQKTSKFLFLMVVRMLCHTLGMKERSINDVHWRYYYSPLHNSIYGELICDPRQIPLRSNFPQKVHRMILATPSMTSKGSKEEAVLL